MASIVNVDATVEYEWSFLIILLFTQSNAAVTWSNITQYFEYANVVTSIDQKSIQLFICYWFSY